MARESQGCLIRRESSVAGSTGVQTASDIAFVVAGNTITSPTGFANMTTGMRVKSNSTANVGILTIKTTGATAITVYETVSVQASGASITLTGHMMQNIGDVVSFNGPSLSGAVIDVTTLQSTAKEKMMGVYDAGQFSISVLFDNEASNARLHDALIRDMKDRTKRQFDIVFKGNSTRNTQAVYFGGYVSAFNITGSVDNALKADITIALASGVDFIVNTTT
jgi:hypothetical protein